jgi:hypothetical protein
MLKTSVSIATILICTTISAFAATPLNCTGSMLEPGGLNPSPKTVTLTLGPPLSIDEGHRGLRASVVSNNQIQLRFATKNFTGEFFHYTNDLFLIYRTGHLAKLSCMPS